MPGRRYEYFNTAEEYDKAAKHALEILQQAEPIARRRKFRIAVENHKCHRIPERLDVMKKLSSEYIGICVDVGNSFSLCEDPMEVVRAYAPYAMTVHLKDQAVREYEDGFLYGDAILGQGFLDLPAMVQTLRQAKPDIHFGLELITRDPLKVPVLTSKYWASMPNVPAADLARTMAMVKAKAPAKPLETVTDLAPDKQIERENSNVIQSLAYARQRLDL
jgi:3-oxoisoapionate decarboxylase